MNINDEKIKCSVHKTPHVFETYWQIHAAPTVEMKKEDEVVLGKSNFTHRQNFIQNKKLKQYQIQAGFQLI